MHTQSCAGCTIGKDPKSVFSKNLDKIEKKNYNLYIFNLFAQNFSSFWLSEYSVITNDLIRVNARVIITKWK